MKLTLKTLVFFHCLLVATHASDAKNNSVTPKFSDYPVSELYQGKSAAPVIPDKWRSFRTRIREGANHGPNFAGHYRIVSWKNGLDTVEFVLLDMQSGRVYDPPFDSLWLDAYSTRRWYGIGLSYRVGSKLLIAEGCPTEECAVYSYEWTGSKFKVIKVSQKPSGPK